MVLFLSSFINLFAQQDSVRFKIKSFELDYNINLSKGDYTPVDISQITQSPTSNNWKLDSDFFTSQFQSYGYGSNGLRGFVNVTPYSKKKQGYRQQVELKLGISILGYNKLLVGNKGEELALIYDTIVTPLTDSTQLETPIQYNYGNSEVVDLTVKKLVFHAELNLMTKQIKRIKFGVSPSFRLSYFYKSTVAYSYFASIDYIDELYEDYTERENFTVKGKKGMSLAPYLNANIEAKLSPINKMNKYFSLNWYGHIGQSFNTLFGSKTIISQSFYGFGMGLKYYL